MAVGVPGADEETVKGLVEPELPGLMEAEALSPYANHAPAVSGFESLVGSLISLHFNEQGSKSIGVPRESEVLQKDDSDHNGVEHGLGIKAISFLNPPEDINAKRLGRNSDKE